MNKLDINTAIKKVSEGVASLETSDSWLTYLTFCSRFYNYSYNNIILILMQQPNASYVASYSTWRKMNRYPRRDEKGIAILCPIFKRIEVIKESSNTRIYNDKEAEKEVKTLLSGFRIGYVFDISQTDGDDSMLPVLVKGLAGNSNEEKALYEALFKYVSSKHCVQEVTGISAKGSYNIETKVISIRSDLEYRQKLKSLAHEFFHLKDFEMNPDLNIPRNKRELLAESCSYVLCLRLGVDVSDYSFGYIKSWLKEPKELGEIADSVQKIISNTFHELAESEDFAFSHLLED